MKWRRTRNDLEVEEVFGAGEDESGAAWSVVKNGR